MFNVVRCLPPDFSRELAPTRSMWATLFTVTVVIAVALDLAAAAVEQGIA